MNVSLSDTYAFLNDSTDFDDIFCMCLNGSWNGLASQLNSVGPTWRCAHTRILRFMIKISVYKRLLLVTREK